MRKLLSTLYVTTPDAYLSLDGENIVISVKQEEIRRIPHASCVRMRDWNVVF